MLQFAPWNNLYPPALLAEVIRVEKLAETDPAAAEELENKNRLAGDAGIAAAAEKEEAKEALAAAEESGDPAAVAEAEAAVADADKKAAGADQAIFRSRPIFKVWSHSTSSVSVHY